MTLIEVLRNKMYPYELPEGTLELLLIEQGLEDASDSFDIEEHGEAMRKANIEGLYQVITLTEESDNGSKLKYNVDAIKNRITHLQRPEEREEEAKPMQIDKTRIW